MSGSKIVGKIQRHNGVAGQHSYVANVQYDDEPVRRVEFVGSTFGGPILMILESGMQSFVTDKERFGEFSPEWVRRFFAAAS